MARKRKRAAARKAEPQKPKDAPASEAGTDEPVDGHRPSDPLRGAGDESGEAETPNTKREPDEE